MEQSRSGKDSLTGYQFAIAGACSGVTTRFLLQPLDVLKIRFQLQSVPSISGKAVKYKSLFQAVKLIVKEEGVPGLWKGHIPAQFLSLIYGGVQFSSYELLSGYVHKTYPTINKTYEPLVNIFCGSLAGVAAVVLSFPFDVIKTVLVFQSEPKVYNGTIDATRKIYKKEGLRGFKKGILIACYQTMPTSGLVFCFHGLYTNLWIFLFSGKYGSLSTAANLTIGLMAGLSSKTIVYPFDLMKKRLQIQGMNEESTCLKHIMKCSSFIHCVRITMKNEGFFGFFRGLTPSLIKAGATTSIYFTVYNKICEFLIFTEKR